MIKTNSNLQYSAPVCKTVYVASRQVICESGYGNPGEAGGSASYNDIDGDF